jgi:hypothetical protein
MAAFPLFAYGGSRFDNRYSSFIHLISAAAIDHNTFD